MENLNKGAPQYFYHFSLILIGFSDKKYCAPLGLTEFGLLRCYQYLAPLVLLGNRTRGAKYW
jgi:hypothetical protein